MKSIGGFFELEIAQGKSLYHDEAIKLSTARACLSLVLQTKKYSKVYVPFYCCDALLAPLKLEGIPFEFFSINDRFEIINRIDLKGNEAIIYCNFFGVKSNYVDELIEIYQDQLIIDNTHAFFIKEYKNNISFTTARKYFGVPDGAFLYYPKKEIIFKFKRNTKVHIDHNLNRLLGFQEKAYNDFIKYEKSLDSSINEISILSEKILKTLDYDNILIKRNKNYDLLRQELGYLNTLEIDDTVGNHFCYPLLLDSPIEKQLFYNEGFFIPSYWLDVANRDQKGKYIFENKLSLELLSLPIDHRYNEKDLLRVVNFIKKQKNGH